MKTAQQLSYANMTRADLIHATTKLALAVEAAEIVGNQSKALDLRERYHLAMAELIAKSKHIGLGMADADSVLAHKRAERTRQGHLEEAARHRAARLGMGKAVPA